MGFERQENENEDQRLNRVKNMVQFDLISEVGKTKEERLRWAEEKGERVKRVFENNPWLISLCDDDKERCEEFIRAELKKDETIH